MAQRNKKNILVAALIAIVLISQDANSQGILEWRGTDRKGVFNEINLLEKWPENGPALIWEFAGLGSGYGSPVITNKNIFINGEIDTISYLFALDLNGKFQWKTAIGTEWVQNYPGSRTTPTVVDNLIYVTTGMGTLACIDANSRKKIWSVDYTKDFHGPLPRFGFSESVAFEGDLVFCNPGSKDTNVVALDRFTGNIKWICKGAGEMTSYCSPLILKIGGKNILINFSKSTLMAIDTKDGKLLWEHKQQGDGDCQVNTPWYEDGFIYYIAGNGNGSVKLKLSDDGTSITEVWKNLACDGLTGGFIKWKDYIYSAGYERRFWYSLNANTGKVIDSLKFDRGTTHFADGKLYLYNERGQMALANPNGSKIEIISSFKITKGTKAHFAHPVIYNGILYIRHGKSLLAYNIKKQ